MNEELTKVDKLLDDERFCHLDLGDRVPDSTILIKLTHKYGEETVRSLNEALVLKLKEGKVIRGRKLRFDTTVVESDIHHPNGYGTAE